MPTQSITSESLTVKRTVKFLNLRFIVTNIWLECKMKVLLVALKKEYQKS